MFCRKCGAELRDDDIFCSKCGVCVAPSDDKIEVDEADSVLDLTQINNSSETKVKNKKKTIIISACIAAAILLVATIVASVWYFTSNNADRLFAAGNYEEAADAYEDMLERDPENTDVRVKLARALLELGEYDDAIETLDYVFRYEKGNSEVYELILIACAGEYEDDIANGYYMDAVSNNIPVNLKNTGYMDVPDLIDLSLKSAKKMNDINITEKDRVYDEAEEDTIIMQSPEAGEIGRLSGGKVKVFVTVSDGPGEAVMKDYEGETLADLKEDLGKDYLIETEDEGSNTVEKGKIIRTVPAAGEIFKKDEIITVYISSGEKIVSVPKITGKTLDQANDILGGIQLGVGSVTYELSGKAEGTILRQSPAYKTKVTADSYVDVVISSGN